MRGSLLPRLIDSLDGGCVDVMVDFETAPSPRITVVRYAGFPCERMHVTVPNAPDLGLELQNLVRTLADNLRGSC